MNVRGIFLVALFVISLAGVGVLMGMRRTTQRGLGFTIHENQTHYSADGSTKVLVSTIVRYQKSDGSWRKETTCNGKTSVGFALAGRGVFHVDEQNKRLDYLAAPSQTVFTDEKLRSEPGFVREETILGFKTFLIHSDSAENGESDDFYICPALQGYPLKRVVKTNGGTNLFEVTQVILGEPSDDLFTSLPTYEINYEGLRR